jgi:hypothetical protein
MSQRIVERVIGRLATDEELRVEFTRAPRGTLEALREQGWELNHAEVDALISTDIGLWSEIAGRIDSRLQRCSLRGTEETSENGSSSD